VPVLATVNQLFFALTLIAALGCGLMAGVFFAFSTFVMKALSRLPPVEGIAAMQSINVTALNRCFMGTFFGTAAVCVLELVSSLFRWQEPGAVFLLLGSALYLIGSLLVTAVFNVPRNNSLASIPPTHPDGESQWADYLNVWTAWNHVRTAASLAAAASFSIALGR
jgi:uncharacterized membrane protein